MPASIELARNLQRLLFKVMPRLDFDPKRAARVVMRGCAVLSVSIALSATAPAFAQCVSSASSCVTCHETQGEHPVLSSTAPWHVDHGFGDLCAACHGGDATASSRSTAHQGLTAPLRDPESTCKSCHVRNSDALAQRYRAAAPPFRSPPVPPRAPPQQPRASSRVDSALVVAAAVLAGVLYVVVRRRSATKRRGFMGWLRAPSWSPFAAGGLLGIVVAVSEVAYARPLAVAGAFDKLAAYPGVWLFPGSQYYAHVMRPGIVWPVWVVLGIFIGAYASAKLAGTANKRWLPEAQWQTRFGSRRAIRLAIAFCGALLVQLGAGIAGGCTSGLAISGGALLAPAAFLFMAGMFAAGIPTAWLWYRKERGR